MGNIFADWNRLEFQVIRQIDPDDLAGIFPGKFESPTVVIAVGVSPIKGDRPARDFDVVNRNILGEGRIGYNIDRAGGIHAVAAHLYLADELTFFRTQMQNNNRSFGMHS